MQVTPAAFFLLVLGNVPGIKSTIKRVREGGDEMIGHRRIDHADLLQIGKMFLLLVQRVEPPKAISTVAKVVPINDLMRAS